MATRTRYIVHEIVAYEVEATSEEDAIEHVVNDAERDTHCFREVVSREAYPSTDEDG